MTLLEEVRAIESLVRIASASHGAARYIPVAVWASVVLALLFISLKVVSFGFLPGGDARRHVGKVFTDKPYTEILVMRPEYTMDHSPGWEWLLRFLHRTLG